MAHTPAQAVRDRWLGTETLPNDTVIQTLVDDAEDTILAAVPDLDARLDDGRIPMDRLHKIVARMVIRHLRNPGGYRQIQETTGPFTRGFTHGGEEPGSIFLTTTDRRELLGGRAGSAYQVDTFPPQTRRPLDAERLS